MKKRLFLVLALPLLFGAGCKEINNLNDMHDQTGKLVAGTAEMSEKMTATYAEIEQSKYLGIQGGALNSREQSIRQMEASKDVKTKIIYASHFVQAMEYQLFNSDLDYRDLGPLYRDAALIYLGTITNYTKHSNFDDLNTASDDPRMLNLFALAYAMDCNNIFQIEDARRHGRKPLSLYDLIKDALLDEYHKRIGQKSLANTPEYVTEINRKVPREALYAFRLRHNFLAAAPLADISKMANHDLVGTLQAGIALFFKWSPSEIRDVNEETLKEGAKNLALANETRDFLRSIGRDEKTDHKLIRVYKHMRLHAGSDREIGTPGLGDKLLLQFQQQIDHYIDRDQEPGYQTQLW